MEMVSVGKSLIVAINQTYFVLHVAAEKLQTQEEYGACHKEELERKSIGEMSKIGSRMIMTITIDHTTDHATDHAIDLVDIIK